MMAEADSSMEWKTAGLLFGERNVLRLDLKESGKSFCWRGRGRSFRVGGPKMEKTR